ncbi:hypothetical protein [Desulfobacula sp.]|uniref:hypothetical protein n=1 Tax=Desulfobacula sp. TaxID=2593537 RepID=UPI00261FD324|nr:hypothetical protein [Desulfobacula sp.]
MSLYAKEKPDYQFYRKFAFIDVPEQAYVEGILGVYEFNQVDLLRDVFVWAYERSCRRYLAITQIMADPDPLRIRYREASIL